ncbi:hypothetical protein, partial [Novacetimonas hansenii]|uniref:hypothetical protein n=1 Tax=Novacetimonas hansenii TaxID=436 RepID=UPI001C4C8D9D
SHDGLQSIVRVKELSNQALKGACRGGMGGCQPTLQSVFALISDIQFPHCIFPNADRFFSTYLVNYQSS